ncbi:hypothetical protein [Halovenus sp. HT40]|uniref:hypothetical protein n=1 Tax=Halovenus sp. HT40 TaxID=3126691 RepID=UPI00300F0409
MGVIDTVELYDDVHLPNYPDGVEPPDAVSWQTKGIDRPSMSTFRITADGQLLKKEWHGKSVPPEERPYADNEDVDEDDFRYYVGMMERVHDGWTERDSYHGRFQITHSFESVDPVVRYQVTFTHGKLEGFERIK